ncbi:MAG: hypothetical protein P8K80_05570 [Phycisphaerales bacterium]|nr:hypothetical protein [Phycisphaerales bacterium]
MRTLPTDMIELTRQEGDALWWACDAFFDHCGQLLLDETNEPDRNALTAATWAGNAIRESLKSAGVDRTIERFPRSDVEAVRIILDATISMDDSFLNLPFKEQDWESRSHWMQACEQTRRTSSSLRDLLAQMDQERDVN